MPASTYYRKKNADYTFGNTAYSPPATFYVGLHTADPGGTGLNEIAGNGYARVAVANNTTNFPNADNNGLKSISVVLTFPVATGNQGTATYFSVWDAASAGNLVGYAALTSSQTINNGNQARFSANQLSLTMS